MRISDCSSDVCSSDLLQAAIGQVWRERDLDAAGIVLVGHSIGSAVALYIAANTPDWPLLGVSFSGMALSPPPGIPAFWHDHRPEEWLHTPADFRKILMFGTAGSYVVGHRRRRCWGTSVSVSLDIGAVGCIKKK